VWRAIAALRMRVSISAIGSVMFTVLALLQALAYQLDFVTPGSSPRSARSRKQMRQRPNLRM